MAVDWAKVPPPDMESPPAPPPPPKADPAFGATATPEIAASALDLSQKTGLSPQWVTDNHESVKAEHELSEFSADLGARPITRAWASDSTRAAAIKDDMGPLGRIEGWLSGVGDSFYKTSLGQGFADIGEAEAMREYMGSGGPLAEYAPAAEEAQRLYDSKEHGYPEAVARALPAMVLYGAASRLGGGVGLAAILYAQNKGVLARRIQLAQPLPPETGAIPLKEGETAEDTSLTPEQVDKYATAGSAVQAVALAGLMTPLLRSLPGARNALESATAGIVARVAASTVGRAAIKALGAWGLHTLMGATGMALQGVINEGTVQEATAGKLDARTLAETGARDFVNSLPVMATFAAYGPARDFLADRGRINAAIANGATLDDLVKSAKESALRRRSPPLAEELFGEMGRGARVFIDWRAAQKVAGLSPEAVAEAEVTQSSVPLPIEQYLARHADDHDAIRGDVKTEADGYTPNEARAQLDNMRQVLTPEEARALYGAIPPDEQIGLKVPIAADLSEADARKLTGEPNPDKTTPGRPSNTPAPTEESPPLHELMAKEYGGTPEEWARLLTPDLMKRLAPPKVSPDHAAAAEQALRQKPIGDIQPGLYKQAAQRAADALTKQAMKSADLAAKRGQERNAVISRVKEAELSEARDAARARAEKATELRDFYDRAFDKLKKNAGSDTYRAVFQKAHLALGALFDGVAQAVGAVRADPSKNPSELIPEALGAMRESNTPVTFDVGAAAELLWKGKPWNSMLPAEADHVVAMVKNLRAAARARLDIRGEELDAAAHAVAQDASVLPAKSEPLVPGNVSAWQRVTRFAGAFNARALERLDILKSLGPTVKRLVVDRYYEAAEKEDQLAREVGQKYDAALNEMPKEMKARRFDAAAMPPELALAYKRKGLPPNADRQFMWTTALMWGDGQARARFVQGLGGERGMSPGGGPFENMVNTWLTDNLHPQEWDFISKVGGLEQGKLWAELKAKEERKSGSAPVESQKAPIYDRNGNQVAEGWYFPLKRDRRAFRTDGGTEPQNGPQSPSDFYGKNYTRPSVQHRFVKERAEQAAYVVDLNWNRIPQHIAEVIHDIAFDEFVTDTAKLLLHPVVDATMKERLGVEKQDQTHAWLKVVANERAEAAQGLGPIQSVFSFLRNRTQSSALGNSLPVLAAMATHSLLSLVHGEVPLSGAIDYTKAVSPAAREFALENSEAVRQRATSGKRQLREDMGLLNDRFRASTVGQGLELAAKIAQFGQDYMDTTLGVGLFNAKYNEVLEKTHDHEAAKAAGNDMVRANLQPREPAEKSMLMNDKGLMSAVLIFHGFFNKVYGKAAEFTGPAANAWRTAETAQDRLAAAWKTAEASGKFLALMSVLALGKLALGRGREEDESWLQWYIRTALGAAFDLLPLASNVTQPIIDKAVSGKSRPVDFRAAPALAGVQKFTRAVQDAANDNKEDQMWKTVDAGVMAAGAGSGQYVKTAKYLSGPNSSRDLARGRVGSFIHGSMYGEQNQSETAPLLLEHLFGGSR